MATQAMLDGGQCWKNKTYGGRSLPSRGMYIISYHNTLTICAFPLYMRFDVHVHMSKKLQDDKLMNCSLT